MSLGYEQDINLGYNAFADPSCAGPEEMLAKFSTWLSSYFDHPDPGALDGLDMGWKEDSRNSFGNMSPEELAVLFEPSALIRADALMYVSAP